VVAVEHTASETTSPKCYRILSSARLHSRFPRNQNLQKDNKWYSLTHPLQCILTLHHKFTIVTHLMVELLEHLKPFASPLLRSIRPSTSPFGDAPWITEDDEALSAALLHTEDGIRVATYQSLDGCGSVPTSRFVKIVKVYPEQVRVIVGLQKDFVPEAVGIENILQEYRNGKVLCSHSTRKLLTPVLKTMETPLKYIQDRNMAS